ncbi:Rho-binding antiterminator [Chitinophaga skermanii]|uniref:Rho-binding antiterminator n=1 Tax=Chitinophaga skermanii TaxID=331697 RepID=A0A327QSS1_9BACT|nr:hypothetical protein [Chitinophaga skermanii]RAJ06742.1 Rho-binding antiterminator [Chitinophaga skermanii]
MLKNTYIPIDCNYYDRLEAWATLQTHCNILYTNEQGNPVEIAGIIQDLFIVEKVEYMQLTSGEKIRLDALVSVNNIPLPPAEESSCRV